MSIEQIKADREAGTRGTWAIHWFECKADHRDVEYAKGKGENLAVGDVLWSVPYEIGPIVVDRNHWAGEYLGVDDEDARRIARVPDLEDALIEAVRLAEDLHDQLSAGTHIEEETYLALQSFLKKYTTPD